MEYPGEGPNRQPYEYKGEYWADTNSTDDDGGVHTNSGPCNRCFCLISKKLSVDISINIFYDCLCELEHDSQYIDFANTLLDVCPDEYQKVVTGVLDIIKIPYTSMEIEFGN